MPNEITEGKKPFLYYNVTCVEGRAYKKPNFHIELGTISLETWMEAKKQTKIKMARALYKYVNF